MSKLIISPSKLERFRQYMEAEWNQAVTADKVIETIKGLQKWTPKMNFGSAFHAILEHGSEHFQWNDDQSALIVKDSDMPGVVKVPARIVMIAEHYRSQHVNMVYEVKLKKWFDVDGHQVLLNGRMDGIEGLILHEQKTASKPPNVDFYTRSYQWRSYLLMSDDAHCVQYNIFHYKDLDKETGVPTSIEPFEFQLTPYPGMKDHVIRLISELIRFCEHYGITDYIKSKY